MKDNFDPEIFRKAASTLAQSMTQQSVEKAEQEKVVENIRSQIDKASTITCEECGHYVFGSAVVLKRVSALMSPTGEEMTVPVQVFNCQKCGGVNKEFLPSYVISDIKKVDKNGIPIF